MLAAPTPEVPEEAPTALQAPASYKKGGKVSSLLIPVEREEYSLGSIARGLSKLAKKAIKNIDYEQAKTAKGEKSRGRRTRKDGTVYALMGDDILKVAKTRSELKGAGKAAAAAGLLSIAASESWEEKNDTEPTEKQATAFEKAFSAAHNAGEETFMFKGKEYNTEVRKGKAEGSLLLEVSPVSEKEKELYGEDAKKYRGLYKAYIMSLNKAKTPEDIELIEKRFDSVRKSFSNEAIAIANRLMDEEREGKAKGGKFPDLTGDGKVTQADILKGRGVFQEGGEASILVPPEMPVDTYSNIPPEEMAEAEASQLPDEEMEDNYKEFVLDKALNIDDQNYLQEVLEKDDRLSGIFDNIMDIAGEFSGEGSVEGPGTGVSDSIPARLSDGEFVFTKKATDQIGADQLQMMMDDAERAYDGGLMQKAFGGIIPDRSEINPKDRSSEQYGTESMSAQMVRNRMINADRMPSVNKKLI
jgi:hypothetical protein